MDWQAFVKAHEARAAALKSDDNWVTCVKVSRGLIEALVVYEDACRIQGIVNVFKIQATCSEVEAEIKTLKDKISRAVHTKEDLEVELALKQEEIDLLMQTNQPLHREKFELAEDVAVKEIELKRLNKQLKEQQRELEQQASLRQQLAWEKHELERNLPMQAITVNEAVAPLPKVWDSGPKTKAQTSQIEPVQSFDRWEFMRDARPLTEALEKHDLAVVCCKFGRTVQYIATGGADSQIRVSDGYSLLTRIKEPKTVMALDFSSNGDLMVSGSWSSSINIYDTRSWTLKRTFKDNKGCVNDVIFGAGDSVVSCCRDGAIKLYDVQRGVTQKKYQTTSTPCSVSRVRGDGIYLTSHYDGHIRGWDFRQDKCTYDVQADQEAALRVLGNLGPRQIITLAANGTIAVRDIRSGHVVGNVRLVGGVSSDHVQIALWESCASPIVIAGGRNGTIYYYDLDRFQLVTEVKSDSSPILCVDCSLSTNRVVVGHQSGVVKLLDAPGML